MPSPRRRRLPSTLIRAVLLLHLAHGSLATDALLVQPSTGWHGTDGNWSTFDIFAGTPGQRIQVCISTTVLGFRVPSVAAIGESSVSPRFNPDRSASWLRIQGSLDQPTEGYDVVAIATINQSASNEVALRGAKITVVSGLEELGTGLGWIGLGATTSESSNNGPSYMPSFINQLAKTPSRVPSSAYGYTAGAFYAGDHGTPASLTLGGYDTARFKPHDRAFKLSYKRSDPTPALTVQSNVATTRYDQENPKALAPVIRVQRIEATTSYQDKLMNFTLSDTNDSFVATIDPATPFLHLPRTVCDQFESYLNLTWDPDLQIYRFRDDVAFQHLQQDSSPLFQFSISGQDGSARLTNISISAKAFALTMGPPSDAQRHSRSQYSDRIPYFPLRRGNDSADFIIGRAFMQEAYLITNYDLGLFSIYQALFPVNSSTNHSIVNIDSTWDFSQFQSSEQKQAIALLGVFLVAWILIVLVVTVLALAGAVLATGSVPAEQQRSSQQAQDGDVERGFDSYESIHLLRSSDIDELSLNGDQASLRPISTERSDDWTQDHTQRHELGVATIQEPEDSPRQTANDNTSKQRQVSGGRPRIAEGRTLGRSLGVSIPEPNIQHTTKDTVYNASSRSDTEGVETSEFDTTSTTSTSDTSISSPTLEAFEKRAVDTLMIELRSLLSHGAHIGIAIRAGGREFQPEHDSKGISSTASSVTASSFQMDNNNKHYRDENGQADHTDQGYGRRDSAKRSRVGSPQYEADSRRFACPFYRRNPKKHLKHRSCAGPGWPSVHRVKEHLYRNHALPIHCNRCGLTMETDGQLRSHQRQAEGCKVCLIDLPEGFDKEQEKELRKRKPGETEEERWYGVYKVLFPDEDGDLVPSPYYNDGSTPDAKREQEDVLEQYERFQRREMLRVVRRLLQEAVSGMAGPLEDQLRTQFVGIIRKAQAVVFQSYRDSNNISAGSKTSRQTPTTASSGSPHHDQDSGGSVPNLDHLGYQQAYGEPPSSAMPPTSGRPQTVSEQTSDLTNLDIPLDQMNFESIFNMTNPPTSQFNFGWHESNSFSPGPSHDFADSGIPMGPYGNHSGIHISQNLTTNNVNGMNGPPSWQTGARKVSAPSQQPQPPQQPQPRPAPSTRSDASLPGHMVWNW